MNLRYLSDELTSNQPLRITHWRADHIFFWSPRFSLFFLFYSDMALNQSLKRFHVIASFLILAHTQIRVHSMNGF